jgi:aspartate/methionine/tyrosine aminotransferase
MNPSKRSDVQPFLAMDVMAEAFRRKAAGENIISMAVGQPADPAPSAVRSAAEKAAREGRIGYTESLGMLPLRLALSQHYHDHYGLTVPASRICITTGSSAAFTLAFLAAFDAGATIAITAPGYPAYRNIIAALGLNVVEIPVNNAHGVLTADKLVSCHKAHPFDGLLIASPANPTGSVIPEAEFELIVQTCRKLGIRLISDEIYHRLNFTGPDRSALALGDDMIVINSFSKFYCMTGWRIGWMILPETMVRAVERLHQSLSISAPEISQIAAIAALTATEELMLVKARYAQNRALLSAKLPGLGLPLLTPADGAFYAYCDVSAHTNDSMDFSRRMLAEIGVAAAPGIDFDLNDGHRAMRFSYAGSIEDIAEAIQRLERWLK